MRMFLVRAFYVLSSLHLGLRIILALGFSNKEWWSLISVLPPWIATWKDWVVNFFPSCPRGRVPHKASGLRQLVEILIQQDVLRPDSERQPLIGIGKWVADFDQHLDQVVGNAVSTRKNYIRYAWRFLMECFGAEEPNWPTLQADQITKFVRREAA